MRHHRYWWVSLVQNGSEFIFTTWVLLLKYDLNHEMCMIFLFFYLKFLCKTLWGEMSKKFWFCWLRGSISISHLSLAPSATTFYHSNLHVRLVPGSICSLNPPHAWYIDGKQILRICEPTPIAKRLRHLPGVREIGIFHSFPPFFSHMNFKWKKHLEA